MMRVAALLPAYEAAPHLGGVLERLAAVHPRADTLVVDDGSRDGTGDVARAAGVEVHTFPENRGKGHALLAGFRALSGYDAVVTLDADGQHPPESLPAFVRVAEAGVDLVLGVRARTADMPSHRRFGNAFSSRWATWIAGQRVADSQCGYRLYGGPLLRRTPMSPGRYELETEIVVRAARLGFRLGEVEIPTVYGEEQSQMSTLRDVPRITGVLLRLTLEWIVPPQSMRSAARAGALP